MKLYVTYTSPYARLARILVIEKALEDRVEIIEAKTRTPGSHYYQINPSGRVPYLVDDAGVGMEDSQPICAYLDNLDGKPRFHDPLLKPDWAYLASSMCLELRRPHFYRYLRLFDGDICADQLVHSVRIHMVEIKHLYFTTGDSDLVLLLRLHRRQP
jgi:glutathione S-transferase